MTYQKTDQKIRPKAPIRVDLKSPLARLVAKELAQEAPATARALSDAIRRQRKNVASILFYGSCLREKSDEGIFDFYVLVDHYRDTYNSNLLALGNFVLPPNVFYIEIPFESRTLRAKYAVLSIKDFENALQPKCVHPYVWARFAQPSMLVYQRDPSAADHAIRCAAQAVVTLVQRLLVFMPATGRVQRFSLAEFWQSAFARTYSAEGRPESRETIASIYKNAHDRYDRAAATALVLLEERGWIERTTRCDEGARYKIEMSPLRRTAMRWRWHCLHPLARTLAIGRLLKTAFTFGDWVPYALLKMERHTGKAIELSERQREHPFLFAWPVIWKVYLRR